MLLFISLNMMKTGKGKWNSKHLHKRPRIRGQTAVVKLIRYFSHKLTNVTCISMAAIYKW